MQRNCAPKVSKYARSVQVRRFDVTVWSRLVLKKSSREWSFEGQPPNSPIWFFKDHPTLTRDFGFALGKRDNVRAGCRIRMDLRSLSINCSISRKSSTCKTGCRQGWQLALSPLKFFLEIFVKKLGKSFLITDSKSSKRILRYHLPKSWRTGIGRNS